MELYDFLIIGGGVVGSSIARELSRFKVRIAVLEKNPDVVDETSGRNSAVVHGGFAYDPGSLKARLCVRGNQMMPALSQELGFPFRMTGKVLVGNTDEDRKSLEATMAQGRINGARDLEMIDQERLHQLVPAVLGRFAMYSPSSGILDPFLYTIHIAENAHLNGAEYFLSREVTGIERKDGRYVVHTDDGDFLSRWVINAAGLGCGRISSMLGIDGYRVIGSKGNYLVLDKSVGPLLPMPVYPVPSNTYMGIHVTPTVDGNVTVGPDASLTDDFGYYGVPQDKIDLLSCSAADLWPHIHRKDLIRTFSGILPKWVDENGVIQDFRIEIRDDLAPDALNLIGIESPGLTAAVPIAEHCVELIRERESLPLKEDFMPCHEKPLRFSALSDDERNMLIEDEPAFADLICSCEEVTRAEIERALDNPLGVRTMTGIKYRTRAMMGRCQSGFCQMKIERLIEEKAEEVLYMRKGSWVVSGALRGER